MKRGIRAVTSKLTSQDVSSLILGIAVLAFVATGINFVSARRVDPASKAISSLVDRDAAQQRAKQNNGEYSFSTGFIPGVGQLSAADQLKKDFIKQNPGAQTN